MRWVFPEPALPPGTDASHGVHAHPLGSLIGWPCSHLNRRFKDESAYRLWRELHYLAFPKPSGTAPPQYPAGTHPDVTR